MEFHEKLQALRRQRGLTQEELAERLLCGVHWVSDIIGGALLSAGLVTLYRCIISICFSSKL